MKLLAAAIAALALPCALAQTPCRGTALAGVVRDSTQAVIPGADLTLDGAQHALSGSDGQFRFPCVSAGPHRLSITAPGFAKRDLSATAPHASQLDVVLPPEEVETQVNVAADDEVATLSPTASGPTQTIAGNRLQTLADDPDDLLRELQQMAAAAGGSPSGATISVDGFQGGDGGTTLPPKSSIAYIKVNPDLFSAEYREPPFGGGRIEVYTKPGQSTFHGALFATNGSPWMNARDPFSASKAPLSKQRYGFEFSGPIRKKGSDFTVTLEHRSIDNYAAVNAITLDSSGNPVNILANVPTPQRRWIGTSRVDWQLGSKNTFIATFGANVNHLQNVGVGGTSLAESGYDSDGYDHNLHITNVTTVSAKLMHEARASVEWDGETDSPISTAPQLQVAGAFTGGGATLGPQHLREVDAEYDDDAILTTKDHMIKFGIFAEFLDQHRYLTSNFNGTYNFGGGIAPALDGNNQPIPGQTEVITGLEQYGRALNGYAGGSPTAYSNVAGNPEVALVQVRMTLFAQDEWKLLPNLHVAYGLRYFSQTDPSLLNSFTPRLGIAWSPDKKATWTIHSHAGMFAGRFGSRSYAEILRMDGVQRVTSIIYNPLCSTVTSTSCNPFTGSTPIHSERTVAPGFPNIFWAAENLGFTHSLPHGWNLSGDYYIAQMWHYGRSENINSPLNGLPTGPRPGPANLNILQLQGSGRGYGNVQSFGLDQHTLKRVQFSLGGVRVQVVDDTDDNPFFNPQTTGSNAGEYARRTNNPLWNLFGNATFTLPEKLQLSTNFNAGLGAHYNITTGFDNNGDGNFNDRPQYATPGIPGAVATPWGLLVTSGGTGVFPRNKGVMPSTYYLDTNLQRAFKLTRDAKAEHQQTLTVNLRSSNVLNHTNVTQVGGVLGSPLFGVPYAADNGRRVEVGLRYSF
jgi:Carboxypeptidase regulatory-like domain